MMIILPQMKIVRIMTMFESFGYALLGCILISMISGPIGCLLLWRRLSFFGDTIAHSALLGLGLGLLLEIPPSLGLFITSVMMALFLVYALKSRILPPDSLLAVLAHGTLSIGLISLWVWPTLRQKANTLLFGDLLTLETADIVALMSAILLIYGFLWIRWRAIITLILSEELAASENQNLETLRLCLMFILAIAVATCLKLVGALLLTGIFIIPAAAARFSSKSPTSMMMQATLIAFISCTLGLWTSLHLDTPTNPTIIVISLGLFLSNRLIHSFKNAS